MALNYKIIGQRIRELRMQKQISQAGLAEMINMSATYISRIEMAKKHASLESLARIGDALGVTVDHLLNGNQENDLIEYRADLVQLLDGCTSYEKRIIYEIASVTKKSLRDNKYLRCKDD